MKRKNPNFYKRIFLEIRKKQAGVLTEILINHLPYEISQAAVQF